MSIFCILLLVGCNGYDGESYDFSNSIQNYVEISHNDCDKGIIVASTDKKVKIEIVTQTPFNMDVTVKCKLEGNGYSKENDIVLPRNEITKKTEIELPEVLSAGQVYTVSIVKCSPEDVRIGRIEGRYTSAKIKVK